MGSLASNKSHGPVRVAIDRGGTFTDVIVLYADGRERAFKLLSRDPSNYKDAPIEALRRILEEVDGQSIPKNVPLNLTSIGAKTALFITKGFRDLLKIGNQSRPDMFALNVKRPELLYSKVVEVPERVTLYDSTAYKRGDKDVPQINGNTGAETSHDDEADVRFGISGERVRVIEPLDMDSMRAALQETFDQGFRSIAICLLHSYTFVDHENALAQAAREIGFTQVSASSELSPAIRMLPRASSAVTDAYLTPEIISYLEGFQSGVDRKSLESVNWRIMQSDGGLVHPKKLSGLRALLSGPAGGVMGYAKTSYIPEKPVPVIGFDMGGTSTDVSRYAGDLELVFESTTAGISIQAPQLDINTVAAGGGSVLGWRKGILTVGPDSAGSHPGPACYRKGGPATVTDANLILGRILPEHFPSIFGPNQDQPLDVEASYQRMAELADEINRDQGTKFSIRETALGFITVANEAMCRPIRALTEARGHNTADHNLAAFGGAGGQHACDIARSLKIKRVVLHKYSSVLSAYGIALAETVQEERLPFAEVLSDSSLSRVIPVFEELRAKTLASLKQMDPACKSVSSKIFLNLRYDGSDTSLMVEKPEDSWDFEGTFTQQHYQEFGFTPSGRDVLIDDVRVRSTATAETRDKVCLREFAMLEQTRLALSDQTTPMFFEGLGAADAPLYHLDRLSAGDVIEGPAMIIDKTQSIVVSPRCTATALTSMLVIDVDPVQATDNNPKFDPIRLSVFANRFMGIAEQMGRALQKTSVSTNIKERLDFSCAIFSADGGLVANAPHVPAMLGSMSFAVKWQIQHWGKNIKKGDVFLSNAPYAGGVHLPDLTVITPVFDEVGEKILFWTASRGHHADVGGIVPGSMPATSTQLWEEGAVIEAMKVIENGVFQEDQVLEAMLYAPARHPGCQGARCIQDNITDIKAQAAANQKGINLIDSLIQEFSLPVVTLYMDEVQKASENAVRETLKTICKEKGRGVFEAEDFMDDGSRIKLKITIDPATGSGKFDFTGTSPQAYGNWNAPIAICNSATIYTLRCLVNAEVPLNQGCLLPVDLIIPDDSFLSPNPEAAVAAGNGLTNQRIVDVILKAFEMCAASNGCMANFTFGLATDDGFGYYETIAGGSGAGPSWAGEDGVHCHMTNTRITDPEILERRYPVLLRQFSLRQGSGGRGKFSGGEGIVRELEYLIDMHAGILSERRAFQPYGMAGGEPGARGENLWIRKNGRVINIGGKAACRVKAGDRMRILTPGGGGYGPLEDAGSSISTALRLAISHGFHRQSEVEHYTHSERVHLNRLWWTVYMQERRLAAATGSPPGINDDVIELDLPTDSPGFNPAAPLCTNIKIVIYGKNSKPEQSSVSSVQQILQAISDISRELPSELGPERYRSTSDVTFRAVASLHFMLLIFGFIDFDALFSAAFIMILSAVFDQASHNEGRAHLTPGLQDALETMRFLVQRGNLAALEKLQEVERLWALMQSLLWNISPMRQLNMVETVVPDQTQTETQTSSNLDPDAMIGNGDSDQRMDLPLLDDNLWDTINNLWLPAQDDEILGHESTSGTMEDDQGSYWSLCNNPSWELTGEHSVDFAEFERHLENLYRE
ncbi:hypothetical protein HJFPF1_08241 [Paramyrothecium foliicola]|nr:hypothetical protein HJFPF1_08241 [Paramyrothecium foliicola]